MLNRSAVIVRPGKGYIDWASSLDDSEIVPDVEGEHTVYLIPEYDDDLHAMEILAQLYQVIFEEELEYWHTDESKWPENRTFEKFKKWFKIEFHSVVEDICDYPVIDDETL
jgi:hypothetical protein